MGTNAHSLVTRLNRLQAELHQAQHQVDNRAQVILYDVTTGLLLPGYEPSSHTVNIYLPDNGRDGYKDGTKT